MSVSKSFYRNVLLLMEVIPPSLDFRIHFHEEMFDKPNTAGFMHVSQYLLTIYDAERFNKLINWPVIGKKEEVKYRNDVKDYLNVIANENPDIDFPSISASYLICANGIKFKTIMWKLSMVALRAYIKRNCNQNIFYAPCQSPADELAKTILQRICKDTTSSIMSYHRIMKEMREKFTLFMQEEEEDLTNIKREMFEKREFIVHLISKSPVNSSIRDRLANIEDTQIIELWKDNINETITYIKEKNMTFKGMEALNKRITSMISSRINGTKKLDAGQLMQVKSSSILLLPFSMNVQYLLHNMYINDKLVLFNFIQLFNLLLCETCQCLTNNKLEDLSECFLQIEASREDIMSGVKIFEDLITSIASTSATLQFDSCQERLNQTYQGHISSIENAILCPSPVIQINTNCCSDENDIPKRLELTPIEGAHKSLFSRYKRPHRNNEIPILQLRKNLLVSRINFNDTISSTLSDKIPQRHMYKTKINSSHVKHAGIAKKYSRLFSSPTTKTTEKGNCNTSYSGNTKSFFDLSKEINIFEKLNTIRNQGSQYIRKEIDNIHDHRYTSDSETDEGTKANKKDDKLNNVENKKKRKSISDLIERYKRIL